MYVNFLYVKFFMHKFSQDFQSCHFVFKIQKLHKAEKRLQYNWDFMNEIEVKI